MGLIMKAFQSCKNAFWYFCSSPGFFFFLVVDVIVGVVAISLLYPAIFLSTEHLLGKPVSVILVIRAKMKSVVQIFLFPFRKRL